MNKFVKLELCRDWNLDYYIKSEDSEFVKNLKQDNFLEYHEHHINLCLSFKENQKVIVKWPDGNTTEEVIGLDNRTRVVEDMGHKYTTDSKFPYIKINTKGLETKLDNFEKLEFLDECLQYVAEPYFKKNNKQHLI